VERRTICYLHHILSETRINNKFTEFVTVQEEIRKKQKLSEVVKEEA
jgi:hypothetical protein